MSNTQLAVTADELQKVLSDEAAFTKIYNFKVQSFADAVCTLLVPFQPSFERPGGIINGAVYMTAADVAMWLAIMIKHGREAMYVSTELNTAFLNAARREDGGMRLDKSLILVSTKSREIQEWDAAPNRFTISSCCCAILRCALSCLRVTGTGI